MQGAKVPIPALMRQLPRDPRGLPITFTSLVAPDGRADFTRADHMKWLQCVKGSLCGLCGQRLNKKMWFIGGPLSMANRMFFDLGMHEECARYALLVCPYLATVKYREAKKRAIGDDEVAASWDLTSSNSTKPDVFGLACTDGYKPIRFQGDLLVQAKRWVRTIEWWYAGETTNFDYPAYLAGLEKVTV